MSNSNDVADGIASWSRSPGCSSGWYSLTPHRPLTGTRFRSVAVGAVLTRLLRQAW